MAGRWKGRLTIASLRFLPRGLLSRAAGHVASRRLPAPLQRLQIRCFARAFRVDLDEIRDPTESFSSLQEFFTRALKAGARPIDGSADALVGPCDGVWGAAGQVVQGTLLQVKGRPYSLAALLGGEEAARPFEGGQYATFYLSPRDYHRFHAPGAVRVVRATYLPGTLWPVNRAGLEEVPALFAQNERICAFMTVAGGGATDLVCMVAIGATMVGKVRVEFDDLTTNRPRFGRTDRHYGERGRRFDKGEEWGRFEFGSTIVTVVTRGLVDLDVQPPGTALRLGTRIGTLRRPARRTG